MRNLMLSALLAIAVSGSVSLTDVRAQWPVYSNYNYTYSNPTYQAWASPYGSSYYYNPGSYTYSYTAPNYPPYYTTRNMLNPYTYVPNPYTAPPRYYPTPMYSSPYYFPPYYPNY